MEYSGAGGKLIHEKNQKQKISWHCPFKKETNKPLVTRWLYLLVLIAESWGGGVGGFQEGDCGRDDRVSGHSGNKKL